MNHDTASLPQSLCSLTIVVSTVFLSRASKPGRLEAWPLPGAVNSDQSLARRMSFPVAGTYTVHMDASLDWRDRIVCDADLHHGEPCIRGTRIPVAILVASLADFDMDALLREYPQLSRQDIQAALLYAAEAAHGTVVV